MEGWVPDKHVSEAVIAGRLRFEDLPDVECRWVVADLTVRGYSAARIAEWLQVSSRHVKRLRAEAMTRVMVALVEENRRAERLEREARSMRSEIRSLRELNAVLDIWNDMAVEAGWRREHAGRVRPHAVGLPPH